MGSLVMQAVAPALSYSSPYHMMVGGGSHHDEASGTTTRARSVSASSSTRDAPSTHVPPTPHSPQLEPRSTQPSSTPTTTTTTAPQQSVAKEKEHSDSQSSQRLPSSSYHSQTVNQHSRGYDQAGFPLSEPQGLVSSSPSSPRLQPTYRSTRSLGGSEATSPSRIKVKNLSHIQSFASEEFLARPRIPRPGVADVHRQYEISAMPVTDIIEMVAGLLTKITTTNDQQHEHVHKSVHHQEDQTGMSSQSQCVLAFHGKNVPSITILSYLSRIHKYCPTTYEVFLSLLVYFDRMTENVNKGFLKTFKEREASGQESSEGHRSPMPMDVDTTEPTAPSESSDSEVHGRSAADSLPAARDIAQFFVVDSYNIHRLVIAGVTCASKFFSDVFYTNSRYAKVS